MKNLLLCFILLGLARTSFAQETEEQIKKTITHEWLTYAKAFELKDYNKIAEFFHYPVLLSGKSYSNKKTVMETYKENREKKFSKGISIVCLMRLSLLKFQMNL